MERTATHACGIPRCMHFTVEAADKHRRLSSRRPSAGDRRITAGHLMQAAGALEHAMSEIAAAQHDADTAGIDADVWDLIELGREPEHMVAALRELAKRIDPQ